MPVVFVHGVSNRKGPKYDKRVMQRTAFLREIVLPTLGLDPRRVKFLNPYWGDDGVRFRWQNSSIPESAAEYESFGADQDQEELDLVALLPDLCSLSEKDIVSIARRSMPEAVDLVWTAAMANAENKEVLKALAKSYLIVSDYAKREKSPGWLAQAVSTNFVDQLIQEAQKNATEPAIADNDQSEFESFGISEFFEELSEAVSRIGNVLGNVSGDIATSLGRKQGHMAASVFIGDVFQYLTQRGDRNQPGRIPKIVSQAFRDAHAACSGSDSKVIVIGHSLGGVITYDVLTHFAPDIEVDVFFSVGSQVGLFEEMTLYKESRENKPPNPPVERLVKPANIKRWLNVFDTSDIFGFRSEGVFKGSSDFLYDTGYGLFKAHGGYFERPSFYQRLAARLKELDT